MHNQIKFVLFALVFTLGVVEALPTIGNPCQIDPTSTGTLQYLPFRTQLQLTITAARSAYNKCQELKNSLMTVLASDEILVLDSQTETLASLPSRLNQSNLTAANNFTRTLQQSASNTTFLYNILEHLVVNGSLRTFDQQVRNVMFAILSVKCRVILTRYVRESNITAEESQTEEGLLLADDDVFVSLEETTNQQQLPTDEKNSIYLAYSAARYMLLAMDVLKDALEAEMRNFAL